MRKIQKVYQGCESDSMGLQHRVVVVDLDKKVLKKVVRKEWIIRRQTWKLNENQTGVRFEKSVKELVSTDTPDLWKTFKDGVLKACDEVCGKKKSRRDRGDMWWWNEEVKDTIARKKMALKSCADFHQKKIRLNNRVFAMVVMATQRDCRFRFSRFTLSTFLTITLVNSKMLRYQKTIICLCFWCAEPKSAVRFLLSRLQIEIFAFYSTYFLVNSGLL